MLRPQSILLAGCFTLCLSVISPLVAGEDGKWLRGTLNDKAIPIWGHADGLQVGLAPLPGPRGLLRVYAPYLDHPPQRVINFIAIEPIPKGSIHRGLSELEFSKLDSVSGKRFWSVDDPTYSTPRESIDPTKGSVENKKGEEQLGVYILVEPFDNGAHVYLKLTFWEDRPHEVGIATFVCDDSVPLDYCIVTATMGNYARLRRLHLAKSVASAGELWPDYRGFDFADHAKFPLEQLARNPAGHAIATAETDEADLTAAAYTFGTREHWKYQGKQALQGWKSEHPDPKLQVWVNGRYTYWASLNPIPGGITFENFEMVSPFRQGEEFIFSVEPKLVAE